MATETKKITFLLSESVSEREAKNKEIYDLQFDGWKWTGSTNIPDGTLGFVAVLTREVGDYEEPTG